MTFFSFSWGRNWIAIRALLRVLGHELAEPPALDTRVIAAGVAESPPFLCYSGKAVIGQLVSQLEAGQRHFLWMSSTGCEACRCAGTGSWLEHTGRLRYPGIRSFRLGGNCRAESLEAMRAAFPGTSAARHDRAFFRYFFTMGTIAEIHKRSLAARALVSDPQAVSALEAKT